jgi:hypothetical protein
MELLQRVSNETLSLRISSLRPGVSAMSYDLHAKLADEFDGKTNWGYRAVDTLVSLRHL